MDIITLNIVIIMDITLTQQIHWLRMHYCELEMSACPHLTILVFATDTHHHHGHITP